MVHAVPKDVPAESDVTSTKGAQSSASVLEKDCIETVYLVESDANVDDAKVEAVLI